MNNTIFPGPEARQVRFKQQASPISFTESKYLNPLSDQELVKAKA